MAVRDWLEPADEDALAWMIAGAEPSACGSPQIDLLQHLDVRRRILLFDFDLQGEIQPLTVQGNKKPAVAAGHIGVFGGLNSFLVDVFQVYSAINGKQVFHVQRAPDYA